jgi:hypothetical protein
VKKSNSGFWILFRIFIYSEDFLDMGPKSIMFKNLDPGSLINDSISAIYSLRANSTIYHHDVT